MHIVLCAFQLFFLKQISLLLYTLANTVRKIKMADKNDKRQVKSHLEEYSGNENLYTHSEKEGEREIFSSLVSNNS